jgi:hypothetical protein
MESKGERRPSQKLRQRVQDGFAHAIGDQSFKRLSESSRRDFLVELFAAVLRERFDERERVQLYIRIPVSEALQDSRDDVSCTGKDCQ